MVTATVQTEQMKDGVPPATTRLSLIQHPPPAPSSPAPSLANVSRRSGFVTDTKTVPTEKMKPAVRVTGLYVLVVANAFHQVIYVTYTLTALQARMNRTAIQPLQGYAAFLLSPKGTMS